MKSKAIGTEGKRNIHHRGIFHRLLHAVTNGVVGIFGFDNGNRCGAVVVEHVISELSLASCHKVASKVYLTISKFHLRLHGDISYRPAFLQDGWRDIAQLDIFL